MRYALIFILLGCLFGFGTANGTEPVCSNTVVDSDTVRHPDNDDKGLTAGGKTPIMITSDDIEFPSRTLQELQEGKDYEIVLSYEYQEFVLKMTDSQNCWIDEARDCMDYKTRKISNRPSQLVFIWCSFAKMKGNELKCKFLENEDSVERRFDVVLKDDAGRCQTVHFIQHPNHQKGEGAEAKHTCICKTSKCKDEMLRMALRRGHNDDGLKREVGMLIVSDDIEVKQMFLEQLRYRDPYEIEMSYKSQEFVLKTTCDNWSIEDVFDYPKGKTEDISPRFAASRFYGSWFHLNVLDYKKMKCVFQENRGAANRQVDVCMGNKNQVQVVRFIQHPNPQRVKGRAKK